MSIANDAVKTSKFRYLMGLENLSSGMVRVSTLMTGREQRSNS